MKRSSRQILKTIVAVTILIGVGINGFAQKQAAAFKHFVAITTQNSVKLEVTLHETPGADTKFNLQIAGGQQNVFNAEVLFEKSVVAGDGNQDR